jgi:hypothetical protein
MFAGTDVAARMSWDVTLYCSSLGKERVSSYTAWATSIAFRQTESRR